MCNQPAKERCRCKQKTVKHGEEEGGKAAVHKHQQHRCNDIHAHHARIEEPQIVKVLYDFLKLRWNINVDVMIEARLDAEFIWQRRPIVSSHTSGVAVTQ